MSVPSKEWIKLKQRHDLRDVKGYAHIMTGGQGTVSLFMHVDQHGTIKDRAVMKDSYLDQAHWDCREMIDRMPIEIAAGYMLASPKTVKLHDHAIFKELRMYRMHLEYAPSGDLFDLVERYVNLRRLLPEPFVWYVAKSMTEVGILMQQGALDEPKTPWRTLFHRDIKLDNMVLGPPLASEFPSYPTPKMMDFGHMMQHYAGNPMPQRDQCMGGTVNWLAPERSGDDPGPMTPASDVYSVGCTLYHMMNGTVGSPIHYDTNGNPMFFASDNGAKYTIHLQQVVLCCMRTDYTQRPTFQQIMNRMRELFDNPSEDLEVQRVTALSLWTVQQADRWIPTSLEDRYELDYQKDDTYRLETACDFIDGYVAEDSVATCLGLTPSQA
nr:hypothetical protein B0A51_05265 [Rachicladosporium sp. CCFEE 5018]